MAPDVSASHPASSWIIYAIASGACAAVNGALAKLTTTALTSQWTESLATLLRLEQGAVYLETVIRSVFFIANLTFNGTMWALFTQALKRSDSTIRVSVMNTSANFLLTALLGWIVFDESLPWLWWVGATLLVAGSVIIGSRDESQVKHETHSTKDKRESRMTSTARSNADDKQLDTEKPSTSASSSSPTSIAHLSVHQRQTTTRLADDW